MIVATVVVPTYNRAHLLETCLQGLVNQNLTAPYEVLVIDDGSNDETRSVVEQAGAASRRCADVRYHWQPNSGVNAGRNRGVALARGELVCFVDDDVDVPPHWLAALVEGARSHPEAAVLGGPIALRFEGRAPRTCGREQLPETTLDLGPDEAWDVLLYGANFAARKETVERLGGFDDTRGTGWVWGDEEEFERRVLDAGGHTLYLPDAGVWHRRTQDELRAWALLRKEFVRGRTQGEYGRRNGKPPRLAAAAERMLRGVYHAVRRRCFTGVMVCARAVGHCAALRTTAPAAPGHSHPGSKPR